MTNYVFQIKKRYSQAINTPSIFIGIILEEEEKRVKIQGKIDVITLRYLPKCVVCGGKLEDYESALGVCESCGEFFGGWEKYGGFGRKNHFRLKRLLKSVTFIKWIPKRVIKEQIATNLSLVSKPNPTPAPVIKVLGKSATIEGGKIVIRFPYRPQLVKDIRIKIKGAHWKPDIKAWLCPVSKEAAELLKLLGFHLSENLEKLLQGEKVEFPKFDFSIIKPVSPDGMLLTPYDFQKIGIAFLQLRNGRALLADEMGLGKTPQSIGYLQLNRDKVPVIILCPSSLKGNWAEEFDKFMPNPDYEILSGRTPYRPSASILIINYDIIAAWAEMLLKLNPKIIIMDECHYIKNPKAQRTKAALKIAKKAPHFIAVSGTPITNRPIEFWPVLHVLDPKEFNNRWNFTIRYCDAKKEGGFWNVKGSSNEEELHARLNGHLMIRRLKAEVAKDLPPKQYTFIPIEIDNKKEYEKAENHFVEYLKDEVESKAREAEKEGREAMEAALKEKGLSSIEVPRISDEDIQKLQNLKIQNMHEYFTQIEALKQLAVRGKLKECFKWIDNLVEEEEKLVIFATHKFVIQEIMERYGKKIVKIDGSVPTNKRQEIVHTFQNNPKVLLFIGNIKAAGVGLTLTAASKVLFLEYPDTPGELDQAADRCHRLSQKYLVNVYYAIAVGTIDEKIAKNLDAKRKVLSAILDGKAPPQNSLMTDLLKDYLKLI